MPASEPVALQRRRFTVAEYERMAAAGILRDHDRLELLDGDIVQLLPTGPVHADLVARLSQLFVGRLGERGLVRVLSSLRLGTMSQLKPDLVVARARHDFYAQHAPEPEDVMLVVEVADASLAVDTAVKLPLYAAAGVPEAWVVDVEGRRVQVHTSALADGFAESVEVGQHDDIVPVRLPELRLQVADIFLAA